MLVLQIWLVRSILFLIQYFWGLITILIKKGIIVEKIVGTVVSIIQGTRSFRKGLLFSMLNKEGINCVFSSLNEPFFSLMNKLMVMIVMMKNTPINTQMKIKLVSFDLKVQKTLHFLIHSSLLIIFGSSQNEQSHSYIIYINLRVKTYGK